MDYSPSDTIAAIATPSGTGGVGIVRVSGPLVAHVCTQMLGIVPPPGEAVYRLFKDSSGRAVDDGYALRFKAPKSFTGEDILELQGHGGSIVTDMVLQATLQCGARIAKPGEFTQRAFLNNKLDLLQAEAVADLIEAGSERAALSAQRSLRGDFSIRVHETVEALIALRVYVEAAIDFPDEEVDYLSDGVALERLTSICAKLESLLTQASVGRLLNDGVNVVIVGRANVGKSSLLNRLVGKDSAIVTEIAGTTRDVVRDHIHLDGLPLHIADTAGLRATEDIVEQAGIRRAHEAMTLADLVLLVVDRDTPPSQDVMDALERLPSSCHVVTVHNKLDLLDEPGNSVDADDLWISAKTGEGVDALRSRIKALFSYGETSETTFIARRRHIDALARAKASLDDAQRQLTEARAGELMAEDLRRAQNALAELTGEFTSDDLLTHIFSSFCLGK